MTILMCFFSIIGLVLGAGFVSGKEVVNFYTRFGFWSFPAIVLSFFIFWFLFRFLLNFDKKTQKNSIFASILSIIITFVFSSAMFAGVKNLLVFENKTISFLLLSLVFFLCFVVFKSGLGALKKLNLILIPIIMIVLIVASFLLIGMDFNFEKSSFGGLWGIYGFLYCTLNVANGSFVLVSLGGVLNKKQKARVSFLAALVLAILLFAVNLILLQNPKSFSNDMPMLSLCGGGLGVVMKFVVLIGSLTSLLSLVYTLSSLIRGLCKNEFLIFSISVIFPYAVSMIGFSFIITYLYPMASALGVFMLGELFYKRFHNIGN